MKRFYLSIILHLPRGIYYFFKMRKYKRGSKYSEREKYEVGRGVINKIVKYGKINPEVYGIENLPDEDGYVLYSNHQGKFDALGIISSHERPLRVVIDKKSCNNPMINTYLDLTNCKRLDKEDKRQGIRLFQEVEKEVKEGKNFLIFPEGEYFDNHNSMIEFHTGCMRFVLRAKCPIVPVCLFDTWKVYGINSMKEVSCQIHFLKPITYEEYFKLDKKEIADLIKERIQEKLNELNSN